MLDDHVIKTVNDILIPDIISEFLHSSLLRHCSKPHHNHTTNPRYTVTFPAQMRWRYHNLALRQRNALNSATYHRNQCDEQAVLHKRTRRVAAVAWQRLYLILAVNGYSHMAKSLHISLGTVWERPVCESMNIALIQHVSLCNILLRLLGLRPGW